MRLKLQENFSGMNEFNFKIQNKSSYDFLCGRVKVLETLLIPFSEYKVIAEESFEEFVSVIESFPYKNFLTGKDLNAVESAIFKRKESEFSDFEKFGLTPFINVFFRSSDYFLLVKKAALGEEVEDSFKAFLENDGTAYPKHFRECFLDLKTDYPFYIRPVIVDVHYLQFLSDYSKLTKSEFIIDFYRKLTENYLLMILFRNDRFVKENFISKQQFDEALKFLKMKLTNNEILKEVTSFESFEELVNEKKGLYGEPNISESWQGLIYKTYMDTFEKGKFFNEGIEPIFVYLLRLTYEASILQKIAYVLYHGLNPGENLSVELAYE